MTTITDNIARCREHLARLEALAQTAPDLLECGNPYMQAEYLRVIICDSSKPLDYWLALAKKYARANWIIDSSNSQLCWDGEMDGVRLTLIPTAGAAVTKVPLFADAQEAA